MVSQIYPTLTERPVERERPRLRLPAAMLVDVARAVDIALLLAATGLTASLAAPAAGAAIALPADPWLWVAAVVVAAWALSGAGVYRGELLGRIAHKLARVGAAFAVTAGVLVAVAAVTSGAAAMAAGLLPWLGTSAALVGAWHVALAAAARSETFGRAMAESVVVAGPPAAAATAVKRLRRSGGQFAILGLFEDEGGFGVAPAGETPILGGVGDMVEFIRCNRVDHVVLAVPWEQRQRLGPLLAVLKGVAVNVHFALEPAAVSAEHCGLSRLGDLSLIRLAESPVNGWRGVAKALEDYAVVMLALPLALPVMGLAALAIRLESRGPVFFRQPRYGFNNTVFEVYKFRTMRADGCDRDGAQQTRRDDGRVTRVGAVLRRTSLDELPQLLNVLRGEMSLVGPRAHPVGMRTQARLCHELVAEYAHRHRMKPGITGWAQVNGSRGAVEHREQLSRRVELDLQYIENWSLALDVRIMALTAVKVLWDRDAY